MMGVKCAAVNKILFCIELSPIIQYNINRLVILMLF